MHETANQIVALNYMNAFKNVGRILNAAVHVIEKMLFALIHAHVIQVKIQIQLQRRVLIKRWPGKLDFDIKNYLRLSVWL